MSSHRKHDCPRCGAPIHVDASAGPSVHCTFCGEDVELGAPPPRIERVVVPERAPDSERKRPERSGGSWIVPLMFVAAAAGGGVYWYRQHGIPGLATATGPKVVTDRDHGDDVEWDASDDPPVFASVSGREDFAGAFWRSGAGDKRLSHDIYVGVFDGTSHERVWYAGPFGRSNVATGATHYAAQGSRLVVTDYRGAFYVYDAASGAQLWQGTLADRARRVCAAPTGNDVWIDVLGDRAVTVDVTTGKSKPAARPAYCADATKPNGCGAHRGRAWCLGPDASPAAPGFTPDHVLFDGNDAVAVGVAAKGAPMLVGFDRATTAVRWSATMPAAGVTNFVSAVSSVAELSSGKVFAQYELKDSKWRLASFDLKSGQRLWDIVVPGSKHGGEDRSIALSTTRLYLSHGDWLDIFDRATGGAIGEFGR